MLTEQGDSVKSSLKTGLKETRQTIKEAFKIAKKTASATGKQSFEFSAPQLMIFMGVIAILLGLTQLTFSTATVTKGYELKRLQADQQQLINQYEIKNMQLAEAKALNTIAHTPKTDSMRRPAEIAYIKDEKVLASR